MLNFREDKCPVCGGKFTDGICTNPSCALGQFADYHYQEIDSQGKKKVKVVSAVEGVRDDKGEAK